MAFEILRQLVWEVVDGLIMFGNVTASEITLHVPVSPVWLGLAVRHATHPCFRQKRKKKKNGSEQLTLQTFCEDGKRQQVFNATFHGCDRELEIYDKSEERGEGTGNFTRLEWKEWGDALAKVRGKLVPGNSDYDYPLCLEACYAYAREKVLQLRNLDAPLFEYLPPTLQELNELAAVVPPAAMVSPEQVFGLVRQWRAERKPGIAAPAKDEDAGLTGGGQVSSTGLSRCRPISE